MDILYESIGYDLNRIDHLMYEYVNTDDFEFIFEDGEDKKESITSKVGATIKSACNKLIKLIAGVLNAIRDTFKKLNIVGKGNKNDKVDVVDGEKMKKEHSKLLKEAEALEKAIDNDEDVDLESYENKVKSFTSSPIKRFMVHIGMDIATNVAKANKSAAMMVSTLMEKDSNDLNIIANSIGKETTEKYKHKIDKYERKIRLFRSKSLLNKHFFKGLQNGFMSVYTRLGNNKYAVKKMLGVKEKGIINKIKAAKGLHDLSRNSGDYIKSVLGTGE